MDIIWNKNCFLYANKFIPTALEEEKKMRQLNHFKKENTKKKNGYGSALNTFA